MVLDCEIYGYWRKLLSLVALLIFGLQFSIYLATGFRDSWAWRSCLALQNTLRNLRGVDRITTAGETEFFLASRTLKIPVVDPNKEV